MEQVGGRDGVEDLAQGGTRGFEDEEFGPEPFGLGWGVVVEVFFVVVVVLLVGGRIG